MTRKIPIAGEPDQKNVVDGPTVKRVGLIGPDYVGMKPTMLVAEGEMSRVSVPSSAT